MLDFTGIKLPFSAQDLLNAGLDLVGGDVGKLILLGMAFLVVPFFTVLMYKAFSIKDRPGKDMFDNKKPYTDEQGTTRDRYGNRVR